MQMDILNRINNSLKDILAKYNDYSKENIET